MKYTPQSLKNLFLKIFLGILCYILLTQSEITAQSIRHGISLCVGTLVPSLLPFMIIAPFTAYSGIFESPNRLLAKITEKLFYLPGYTYPAIILSFIGGYPVGAKSVKALYENKKINKEQLNRMMCFCVNSGPAFTVSMLGSTLLNNKMIGLIIFLIQIMLALLIGIVCAAKSRISKKTFYFLASPSNNKKIKIREAFVNSVASGCESIIQMCGIVIIFIAFIGILENFNIFEFIYNEMLFYVPKNISKTILTSFLEVTYGCIYAAKSSAPYWIMAFGIGYGGICTHLQIAAILKETNFKYSQFCIFRFINGILSALVFYAVTHFFPIAYPTFSAISKTQLSIKPSSTPIGSIALIFLCFYFLADIKLNKKFKK